MNEYVADGHHGATPDELLRETYLNDSRREQVKQYLAVIRYTMFKNDENNDTDSLRPQTVGSDVAD